MLIMIMVIAIIMIDNNDDKDNNNSSSRSSSSNMMITIMITTIMMMMMMMIMMNDDDDDAAAAAAAAAADDDDILCKCQTFSTRRRDTDEGWVSYTHSETVRVLLACPANWRSRSIILCFTCARNIVFQHKINFCVDGECMPYVSHVFDCALSLYHFRSHKYWVRVCLLWVYVVIEHMVTQNGFKSSHHEHEICRNPR